jgi:hypothetical protein
MNPKIKSFLLWLFAFIFTLVIAVYQRVTGPTYPARGKAVIAGQTVRYKLIRSYDGDDGAPVYVNVPDTAIRGEFMYRRFKSYDEWTTVPMERKGDSLVSRIPHQPVAGKVMYRVILVRGNDRVALEKDPVVIRYKGKVPMSVLIPHILIIFLAMLFSTRTGLEVLFRGKFTFLYTWITIITLFIGGLILGPVVQKFSFGMYWAGWPFGHDLTDNKAAVAFIFWVIALVVLYRNRGNRAWPLIASIIMLIVFLIPHSVLGSEIDYTKGQKTEIRL